MQDEDSKDPQSMKDVEDQKAAKKKSAQRKVSKNTMAKMRRRSYQDRCCSGWHRDGDRAGDHPPHHGGRGRGQGHHHRRQARPQRVHLPTPRPAGGLVILALLAPHTNFPTISASLTDSNACAGALQQQVHRCGLHSLQRIRALSGNNIFVFVDSKLMLICWYWCNVVQC